MVHNFSKQHSLVSNWVSELRDVEVQNDRMRFRRNLERIAEVIGYEISKELETEDKEVTTPMGIATAKVLKEQPVLATILRAGLAMHNGLLHFFDHADNAFLSAYRKHQPDGSFEISMEYMSCPELDGRVIILSDNILSMRAILNRCTSFVPLPARWG
jgi:uracil phosphoribosyltransferase